MIYCVVPQALADELYDKLADYYRGRPACRRSSSTGVPRAERPAINQSYSEHRRQRPKGSFPAIEPPRATA